MPIYEYQCQHCNHTCELLRKLNDPSEPHCPQCNHSALTKLISRSSFKLTGTGWYETDFKTKPQQSSTDTKTPTPPPSTANTKKTADQQTT